MPAKTVIFNELTKYDNNGLRNLRTDEYLQMSGRAGRRGLDKNGTVILLPTFNLPNYHELKNIMTGKSPGINSRFVLSYQFILKSIHNKDLNIENFVNTTLFLTENRGIILNYKYERKNMIEEYNNSINYGKYNELDKCIIDAIAEYINIKNKLEGKNKTYNGHFRMVINNKERKKLQKKMNKIKKTDNFDNNLKIVSKHLDYENKINDIENLSKKCLIHI